MKHFDEKELEILRHAVDNAENISQREIINNPEVKYIINIVEEFIIKKKCICYGGTAINNILPVSQQFYNKSIELPDYDFYSTKALDHAKELADIYNAEGFNEVEAKAGVHHGTYKVFVNFIPVADITQLNREIFNKIKKEAITVNKILYAPPNFLRMSMYLELSRPRGDVSRWEKVLKRLILLNNNYPIKTFKCNKKFLMQRNFTTPINNIQKLYNIIKNTFINMKLVFFGGYANVLYSHYMPKKLRTKLKKIPDFDVLSENPKESADTLKNILIKNNYTDVSIKRHSGIGEIIAVHYEITVQGETVAFIYEPLACHSYNIININNKPVKIATIDTMLSFFLAFIYSDRIYYDHNRILCMVHQLFMVQQKNRLKQKGLLKRFSINCFGNQESLEDIRSEKAQKYSELQRGTREYEEWFLKYNPNFTKKNKTKNNKTKKNL